MFLVYHGKALGEDEASTVSSMKQLLLLLSITTF
jgi:hypothetical protein